MDAAVRFQVSWSVKTGSTDGAVVGLFSYKQGGRGVRDIALKTAVGTKAKALSSPTCMHSTVTGQVAFVAEGRPAELTLIGFVLLPGSQGVQPR